LTHGGGLSSPATTAFPVRLRDYTRDFVSGMGGVGQRPQGGDGEISRGKQDDAHNDLPLEVLSCCRGTFSSTIAPRAKPQSEPRPSGSGPLRTAFQDRKIFSKKRH
jgi:hypothetical protein